jgi:uncharacterized protein (DUF924 family)
VTGGDWRSDVLKFWFGLPEEQWWSGAPELDGEIRDRFLELWEEKRQLPADFFLDDPLTAIAGVILFDQFPRNMFRGDAEQFSTDTLALPIAKGAVNRKLDEKLSKPERKFLYMPFEHSEALADQDRAVELMRSLEAFEATRGVADWAEKHRTIIRRFGRFPHRNAALGRPSTAAEAAFLQEPGSGF